MLRSFLARPHPLLSHLRRHDWLPSVARLDLNRRADRIPSRSYTSSSSEDDTTDVADQSPVAPAPAYRYGCTSPSDRRQHLYVVLEDWKKGFSIHKFDLHDGGSDTGGDLALRPPVHRQEKAPCGRWNFAALGSKIVATGRLNSRKREVVTLAYDTETMGLSIACPTSPYGLGDAWTLAAAMENRLYVFQGFQANSERGQWASQCNTVPSMHRLQDVPLPGNHETCWSWTTIESPLPFSVSDMESTALHPEGGGHALFVSTGQWQINPTDDDWDDPAEESSTLDDVSHTPHTFSYDAGSGEWRRHGEWGLPFCGLAHYNAVLDAWVGLHKAYQPLRHVADGYICSCDVVSPDACTTQQPNHLKICAERLFDPGAERHLGASLVHTGDMNYCLVEVAARQKFMAERCGHAGNKCTVRLSTFRLQYGKNGELTITAPRSERSYRFSRFDSNERVQVHAFWM